MNELQKNIQINLSNIERGESKLPELPAYYEKMRDTVDYLPFFIGAEPYGEGDGAKKRIVLVVNFIITRFRGINPDQVVDAFELAASGDLFYNNKPVSIETYGRKLSVKLVGQVLAAYKERLRLKAMQPPPFVPTNRRLEEPKPEPVSNEYHYNNCLKQSQTDNKLPSVHLWEKVYSHICVLQKVEKNLPKGEYYFRREIQKYFIEIGAIKPNPDAKSE